MIWESKININKVFKLRYGGVNLYFGVGAINKIREILRNLIDRGITRILIVTGKTSYKVCGAWDYVKPALEEHNIQYVLYDKVSPNPTVDMVDDAVRIGKEFKATSSSLIHLFAVMNGLGFPSLSSSSPLIMFSVVARVSFSGPIRTCRDLR